MQTVTFTPLTPEQLAALNRSYQFYHSDVEPRRARYRTNNFYTTPVPIEEELVASSPDLLAFVDDPNLLIKARVSPNSGKDSVNPKRLVLNANLDFSDIDVASPIITAGLAAFDSMPERDLLQQVINVYTGVNGTMGLTGDEVDYLRAAYNDEVLATQLQKVNRLLRQILWQEYIKETGIEPTIDELNEFIMNYDPEKLYSILEEMSGGTSIIFPKRKAPILRDKSQDVIDAMKLALIHVAQNDAIQKSNNSVLNDYQTVYDGLTAFAKFGGKLNYLNLF